MSPPSDEPTRQLRPANTITASGIAPPREQPRPRVGRYELLELVGEGGMGKVYLARDTALDRRVALKLVEAHASDDMTRLLREARALAQVHHDNVIPIFDVGATDNEVFLVMPYLAGGTLRSWLRARPRSWRATIDLYIAAGRGLCAAHAAGLIHRDFKPDNVILDERGHVFVADFGLARASREFMGPMLQQVTRTGQIAGTPRYMAPEQLAGEALDARADQFAFAVALWESLCGQPPFSTSSVSAGALLDVISHGPPIVGSRNVPKAVLTALRRALATDPVDRWLTLADLLAELDGVRRRRRRRWIGSATILTTASMTVGLLALTHHTSSDVPVDGPRTPANVSQGSSSLHVEQRDPRLRTFTVARTYDPATFDASAFVPEARQLARRLFADAELDRLTFHGVDAQGRIDLRTPSSSAIYDFRSPSVTVPVDATDGVPCRVWVEVKPDAVTVRSLIDWPGPFMCNQPLIATARCSLAEIWRRARAANLITRTLPEVQLYRPNDQAIRWMVEASNGDDNFYPDDCK